VRRSVTYVALSALASSEDVDLMGRVIVQDLKQLCARRLRQLSNAERVRPLLVVLDEFAALGEPDQILDLMRQAREARVSIVVSTQHMPVGEELQSACLGAGLLIAHRVAAPDAELIAAQFGTRSASDVTHQIDYETGSAPKGSIRRVDKFHVHPNELREFEPGQAAFKSAARRRYTIVQIFRA
jgi:TraM recognition site of TraD and TraG